MTISSATRWAICTSSGSREGLLIFYRPADGLVTEEEYALCMRQFESMPNLVRLLAAAGKLAPWVEGDQPLRG